MKWITFFIFLLSSFNTLAMDSRGENKHYKECLKEANQLPWYQVDDRRFQCLEKYINNITLEECDEEANKLIAQGARNNWRTQCLEILTPTSDYNTCMEVASNLPWYLSGEAKFKCLEYFKKSISFKQCDDEAGALPNAGQRNDWRLNCLSTFRSQISFDQCIATSNKLPWFLSYDEKLKCLDFNHQAITFSQCEKVASRLSNYQESDEWRWLCLDLFIDEVSYNECQANAKKLSNTQNFEYMKLKCEKLFN